MHRRKKQRHHRLRHPRARRQRAGEGLKTVLAPQLVHESGERRGVGADGGLVHAFGGDRAPPGHRTGRPPPDLSARARDTEIAPNPPPETAPPGAPPCPAFTLSRNVSPMGAEFVPKARLTFGSPRPPPHSIEAALRLFEPVARERLHRVAPAGDDRLGVVLRREGREHVVGNRARIAAARPPDADTKAKELL